MHHKLPVSLYLVVRPADADRLRPLIRLMVTQIIRRLTEHMDFEGGPQRCSVPAPSAVTHR